MDIFSAFAAGVLSFLSPCILPLLPGYLSFLTGYTLDETAESADKFAIRRKGFIGAICFGIGFTIVFIAMGATATAAGRLLIQNQFIISKVFGVILMLFGLHMMGILRLKFLYKEKKLHVDKAVKNKGKNTRAFIMGLAFAFGWTPCIGPILGGILTLAAQKNTVSDGILLLSSYSLGLWLPFLIAALFTVPVLSFLSRYPKLARRAEFVAGVLLFVMGVLMLTGQMARINALFA